MTVRTKTTTEVVTSSEEVEWLHKGDLIDALRSRLGKWGTGYGGSPEYREGADTETETVIELIEKNFI